MKYPFLVNKTYEESSEQYISTAAIRRIGNIPEGQDLFWKVQGADEKLTEGELVDLGRLGIEQLYSVPAEKYQYIIDEKLFISHEPFITEEELRTTGHVPPGNVIFFREEGKDRQLKPGDKIDLRPYPVEEFYSREIKKLVTIIIDRNQYEVKPGKYAVEELKKIGKVSAAKVLDQLIDNILVELATDAEVAIKGGEEFKSFVKGGTSS